MPSRSGQSWGENKGRGEHNQKRLKALKKKVHIPLFVPEKKKKAGEGRGPDVTTTNTVPDDWGRKKKKKVAFAA